MNTLFDDQADDAAQRARDRGLEKVTREGWQNVAMEVLRMYAKETPDFIAEEFRLYYLKQGGPKPHHHNAWGALFRQAAIQGIIEATGEYKRTKSKKTHTHPTAVWRHSHRR